MHARRDLILLHLESMIKLLQTRWLQGQDLFCTCLSFFFSICLLTEVLSFLWDTLFIRESSIPPSPLVMSLFPEKTKKGHYNSRVVLKSQPKLSLSAALHQQQLLWQSGSLMFAITPFLLSLWWFAPGQHNLSTFPLFVFIPSEEMKYLDIVETNSSKNMETALKKWKQTALWSSQQIRHQIITWKNEGAFSTFAETGNEYHVLSLALLGT